MDHNGVVLAIMEKSIFPDVATIGNSNAAFLDGSTVLLTEYASAATTIPLDIDLWHRRLAHHHLASVRTLLDKN